MIEYRRLEGELDPTTSTKIEAFILDAYGERASYKYPHRFSWLYGHERAFSLTAWDGDKVIGFVGSMPITLVRDGQALSAAWSVDNIVLSRYRGQGIGTALQRLAEAEGLLTLSTWVAISNLRIKERLGNIKIGQLVTLANKQPPLRYEKYDVEQPEADRISAVASKAVRSNDLYVKRDGSYCKWRFLDQPYSEYRLLSTRWGIALLRKCGLIDLTRLG